MAKTESEKIKLPSMKYAELRDFLVESINIGANVAIVGPPACGKSACAGDAIRLASAQEIVRHAAWDDPTDIKGLPFPRRDGTGADFVAFGDILKLLNATEKTVLRLEDFGQAKEDVQTAYMPLILDRLAAGRRISDHVVSIIATANRKEDRAASNGFLETIKSRFDTIVEMEIDGESWMAHEITRDCHPAVIAYHQNCAPADGVSWNKLYEFNPSPDMTNSPNFRTWDAVGNKWMKIKIPESSRQAAIAGAIGDSAMADFYAYLNYYKLMPSIELILKDGKNGEVPDHPAVRYAVIVNLVLKATRQTMPQVILYMRKLYDMGAAEFAAAAVKLLGSRPELKVSCNTADWSSLISNIAPMLTN